MNIINKNSGKKYCLILFAFLVVFINNSYSQGSSPIWIRDYAWGGDSSDICKDVIETTDELGLVVAGHTDSSSTNEQNRNTNGNSDFWALEEDTLGNLVWNQIYGGDSAELFSKIVQVSDGYLLTGSSASGVSGNKSSGNRGGFDYWVVKVDKNGVKQWDRNYGGDKNDFLVTAKLLNNGNVVLGGNSISDVGGDKSDAQIGKNDYWLIVISASTGDVVWDITLGGDEDDYMTSVHVDGGVFVGGYSNSDISGNKTQDSYGGYDYWIVKLNQLNGLLEWETTVGGAADDFLIELSGNERNKSFYAGGTSNSGVSGVKTSGNSGGSDFWLLNLDSIGGTKWEINLGGTGTDVLTAMVSSPEGAVIVGGYSNSGISGTKTTSNNGGFDYWIVKVDTLGSMYWERTYGGSNDDTLTSIYIRCDRGLYLGGHSTSGISGDRTYSNRGDQDYWVINLDVPTIPDFLAANHCYGTVMHFFDNSEIWPDEWTWDFGDPLSGNNSSIEQHPLHQFSSPGDYDITLTIKEGCQNDTVITKSLTVYENRILGKADLGRGKTICYGETLVLKNNKNIELPNDVTYLWGTGETAPEVVIDSVGKYYLSLTSGQCTDVDTVEIDHCPIIFAPNAFTPNADGTNELWGLKGVGIRDFTLYIYDRWGMLLFEADDINDWWDGAFKGKLCQQDVYVFKAIYSGLNTSSELLVGTITLVR